MTPAAHPSEPRPGRRPRTAAARRRRLLGILAALTLVAALAVGVGALAGLPVPAWVVAIPGGLMVAYLVLLAVVRPGARQPSLPVHEELGSHVDAYTDEAELETADRAAGSAVGPVARPRELVTVAASPAAVVPVVEASRPTVATHESGDPVDSAASQSSSTWTPVPVPTPTYVTAPRARRAVRTIDLSNPGSWTAASSSAPMASAGAPAAGADGSDAEAHDEYVVEHRRAVGD